MMSYSRPTIGYSLEASYSTNVFSKPGHSDGEY